MSNVITSIEVDYDARLVEAAESIASSLERIVELIENGIEKEDEYEHDDEEYEEPEEHTNLFAGIGGIRKGLEEDKSRPEKGEKRI
tara:strand:- start:696 stop:953 length:258 start_codon:yes stop_codon:yes gene_type:complete